MSLTTRERGAYTWGLIFGWALFGWENVLLIWGLLFRGAYIQNFTEF